MTRKRDISKHLLVFGIAAPFFIVVMVIIAAVVNPGYSHLYNAVSRLGTSSVSSPYLFNVSMIMYGFMMCVYAYGIYGQLGRDRKVKLMTMFTVIHGVGMMLAGIFRDEVPSAGQYTAEAILHSTFAIMSYLALLGMMVIFNFIVRYTPFRKGLLRLTVLVFVVGIPLLGMFIFRADGPIGLYQRIGYGIAFLWIVIVTVRLILFLRKLSRLMIT